MIIGPGVVEANGKIAVVNDEQPEFVITVSQTGSTERFTRTCRGRVVLGRGDDVDIQLAHPAISRRHAEISLNDAGEFVVRDLGSRNGTSVNGEKLDSAQAATGLDLSVELGPYVLALSLAAASSDTIDFSTIKKNHRVVLSNGTHALEVDGKQALTKLAGLEFHLFELLAAATPNLVPNADIGEALWGKGQWDSYMLHNLVRRVRRKLEEAGYNGDEIIASVPGVGYRLA